MCRFETSGTAPYLAIKLNRSIPQNPTIDQKESVCYCARLDRLYQKVQSKVAGMCTAPNMQATASSLTLYQDIGVDDSPASIPNERVIQIVAYSRGRTISNMRVRKMTQTMTSSCERDTGSTKLESTPGGGGPQGRESESFDMMKMDDQSFVHRSSKLTDGEYERVRTCVPFMHTFLMWGPWAEITGFSQDMCYRASIMIDRKEPIMRGQFAMGASRLICVTVAFFTFFQEEEAKCEVCSQLLCPCTVNLYL